VSDKLTNLANGDNFGV